MENTMTSNEREPTNPIPEHLRTVTPRLVVTNGEAAIEFYKRAFGAEQVGEAFKGPSGEVIHAEIRIGDSIVMLTEDSDPASEAPAKSPEALQGFVTAIMALYFQNVDDAWDRALAAGAEVIYPLADHFYGERGGRVRDPFGQQWMLSQHIENVTPDEMERRAAPFFQSGEQP